jgi:threonine/homoserine/homoserine lactone efflux protein
MTERSSFSFYRDGFVVAGTSPKAWAFFPLIFPQFIDFNSNYIIQFLILITTYVVLDFLSLIGYAIVANKLIIWIKANPRFINTISACFLIIIAFIIAFTRKF